VRFSDALATPATLTAEAQMTNATVHDPVCHMDITPDSAFGTSVHEDKTYYFCARGCKLDFDDDPAAVLAAEAAYDHSQPMDHMMGVAPTATSETKKPWWKFW
jgi:YHS domain-containing protein